MVHPDLRNTLPSQLKAATDGPHRALEASLEPHWAQLGNPGAYARLLEVFYGYYAPLEARISAVLPAAALSDAAQRRKAGWIIDDLRALGIDQVPPHSPFLPAIDDEAAAWGALYVLEGSTLGGRHICNNIRRQLPGAPTRFFSGYGAETGPAWLRFQAALQEQQDRHSSETITESARSTFENFRQWISNTL